MGRDHHFKGGSWYRVCDMSGFVVRAEKTRKQWNNIIVRNESWEARQPQDFVKGVRDEQNAPEPRPRQLANFQGPLGTTLTTTVPPSQIAPFFLQITSSIRYFIADVLNVMMDNGEVARVTVVDVPVGGASVQVDRGLPFQASAGNVVINVTAESDPILLP